MPKAAIGCTTAAAARARSGAGLTARSLLAVATYGAPKLPPLPIAVDTLLRGTSTGAGFMAAPEGERFRWSLNVAQIALKAAPPPVISLKAQTIMICLEEAMTSRRRDHDEIVKRTKSAGLAQISVLCSTAQ